MNLKTLVPTALLLSATALFAADKGSDASAAKKPADTYPLKTCLVSDEPLGSMGDSIRYVHKEAGQPDREVRFCCDGCIDDFKADPKKFLAKLDAAEKAAKSAPAKKSEPAKPEKHGAHQHE